MNKLLLGHYTPEEMLIFDDLWFWGYFTQDSRQKVRVMGWNSDKFWCQRSAPTASEARLKALAERFLTLVNA